MREGTLKVVLILFGLLFLAGVYPLIALLRQEPTLAMMMSLYVTLGVFLLFASRNPSANRSLIGFAGWSSLAHASVMAVQVYRNIIQHREVAGVVAFALIGVALLALAPAKRSVEPIAAAAHSGQIQPNSPA